MHLVLSKRFEISLSYRYFRPDWPDEKNREVYGPAVGGAHGFGGNFTVYFVFNGPVDSHTGMIINVTVVKERIKRLLAERYDHKFLNLDTPPFDHVVPTPERLARQLLDDVRPLFIDEKAGPVVCHVDISPVTAATAYADGRIERHYWLEFSAARRTWSPHLTETENFRLFGKAASPSGHGHYYRMRVTLRGDVDDDSGMIASEDDAALALREIHDLLDHRNLTTDVPQLRAHPLTTEYLSRFLYDTLAESLPLHRVRLWENPYFYSECLGEGNHLLGISADFRAAHRLHSPYLSDEENLQIYGKCDNPNGHGHRYVVEAAIAGKLDDRSGTMFPLDRFRNGLAEALQPWDYRHLDADTDDFADRPSTGENIVQVLWPRVETAIDHEVHRLRLWETPNNRFTLRREIE